MSSKMHKSLKAYSRVAIIRYAYSRLVIDQNAYALLAALDFVLFAKRRKRLLSSLGKQAQCLQRLIEQNKFN